MFISEVKGAVVHAIEMQSKIFQKRWVRRSPFQRDVGVVWPLGREAESVVRIRAESFEDII